MQRFFQHSNMGAAERWPEASFTSEFLSFHALAVITPSSIFILVGCLSRVKGQCDSDCIATRCLLLNQKRAVWLALGPNEKRPGAESRPTFL